MGIIETLLFNSNKANISDFGRIKKLNMFNSDFYVFSYYTQKENSYALFSDEFNIENSSIHLYLGNVLKGYQINISDSNIIVDFNLLEKEKVPSNEIPIISARDNLNFENNQLVVLNSKSQYKLKGPYPKFCVNTHFNLT
ncbi:hypothetical protein QA310_08630, partial [Glaesserella parasuis]|nr:hypothetical protein [Glaesserella parasuis]